MTPCTQRHANLELTYVYHSPRTFCGGILNLFSWGAWVAQLTKHPTLAQVMISWFVSGRPTMGSVLTAQSLELASDSLLPSLSAPPLLMLSPALSLSLSKMNKH